MLPVYGTVWRDKGTFRTLQQGPRAIWAAGSRRRTLLVGRGWRCADGWGASGYGARVVAAGTEVD